jgi:hypothetical protein
VIKFSYKKKKEKKMAGINEVTINKDIWKDGDLKKIQRMSQENNVPIKVNFEKEKVGILIENDTAKILKPYGYKKDYEIFRDHRKEFDIFKKVEDENGKNMQAKEERAYDNSLKNKYER